MEHWWSDVDGVTEKLGGEKLFKYHFVHHRCHMQWHGIKFRPLLMRGQQVELFMLSHAF